MSLTYRTTTTRTVGPVRFVRAEDWRYTATDLNQSGVISLDAELVGFGVNVTADGHDVPSERISAARAATTEQASQHATLALRMSGKIVSCSAETFGDALPHRLLAMHVPVEPVLPGDPWVEEGLARTFEAVIPVDVDVQTTTQAILRDVVTVNGGWRATIDHLTRIQVGALGPSLEVIGRSLWDTNPGAMRERSIQARWLPDSGDGLPVGMLDLQLQRLES